MLLAFSAVFAKAQTPADSVGVYMVRDNVIKPIEAINFVGSKVSRGFMSAKSKLEFQGGTSKNQFKGSAKLRIYFGQPATADLMTLYMFTPSYKINDFAVGQFEVKDNKRLLTTSKAAVFGGVSGGAQASEKVHMSVVELRPNVYEIMITGAPGEYCIMHNFRGGGGFGGVFDFTILP